ncbi:MAG: helix-turn-helix domain-containing protein [Patescibacteria group bacterium]
MRKEVNAGVLLAKARLEKNLKIENAALSLNISTNSLTALEHNNLEFFYTRMNAEGVAQKYAELLGIDSEMVMSLVRRDYIMTVPEKYNNDSSKIFAFPIVFDFSWWSGVFVLGVSIIFFGYQIYLYLLPPSLKIIEPQAKSFKRVEKVRVKGEVDKESEVKVNGVAANVEGSGVFFVDTSLKRGKNEVVVEVVGTNGRKTIKTLELMNE